MNCRRCRAENPETSRYCSSCGALLTKSLARPRRTVPWFVIAGARDHRRPRRGLFPCARAQAIVAPCRFRIDRSRGAGRRSPQASGVEALTAPSDFSLAAGRFALEGSRGPSSIESAFFDGAWTALPLWAFMGSAAPRLESPGPPGILPAWVDWNDRGAHRPLPLRSCREPEDARARAL